MPTDSVSVTLAAGSPAYQKTLASSLLQAGMLRRLFDQGPYLRIQEPDGNGSLRNIRKFRVYTFARRAAWAIWRRLPEPVRPVPPATITVSVSDRLLANWITPSTIFHGRTGTCLICLRTAKRQGALTLVDNASRHPQHWKEAEQEEFQRFGVSDGSGDVGESMMRRREQEFQFCDRIVVPSALARQSFAEMGYGEKTEVVPIGVDDHFFVPNCESRPSIFRVCFVGRVELAKGLGDLLQAWKRLALPQSELVLVGAVRAHAKSLLATQGDSGVRLTGFLPPQSVLQCYRESSLFVLPSPNEGLAQVLLEAMACGLPVVASDMSGANECVTEGKEGFIVPTRNVDRLAEAILWCYQHQDELPAMGQAARARIESNFTLEHYNQRMIALYRKLAARS